MKRVLLVGGGTGGHIMPLIAVAEEMQKAGGVRLDYMGPRSQFLSDFEARGIKCHTVPGSKMRRYFSLANIFMPFELLAGFIVALFKLVYRLLNVDVTRFKRSDYVIKVATVLFTALAIWILLVNPPFYVMTPPSIRSVTITENTASGWQQYPANGTVAIPAGTLNISAVILHDGTIAVWIRITNSSGASTTHRMTLKSDNTYSYVQNFGPGSFGFTIITELPNGSKTTSANYPITVS